MAETSSGGGRWRRREAVLWRESLGGLVLLPPEADEPFAVSAPAASLWEALARPRAVDELAAIVTDATGEADGAAASDLDALLTDLAERGALERR